MKTLVLVLMAGLLVGCAGSRFATQLDARLGQMTPLDAIQAFGPPSYAQEVQGRTVMAWERRSYTAGSYQPVVQALQGTGFWAGTMRGIGGVGPFTNIEEERETLILTFGPDDRLQAWRHLVL